MHAARRRVATSNRGRNLSVPDRNETTQRVDSKKADEEEEEDVRVSKGSLSRAHTYILTARARERADYTRGLHGSGLSFDDGATRSRCRRTREPSRQRRGSSRLAIYILPSPSTYISLRHNENQIEDRSIETNRTFFRRRVGRARIDTRCADIYIKEFHMYIEKVLSPAKRDMRERLDYIGLVYTRWSHAA